MKDAIEIFKLNVAAYPEASNPYDCLDEAYMVKGDKKLAIKELQEIVGDRIPIIPMLWKC